MFEDFSFSSFIIRVLAILLSLTVHEFSHGFSAYLLGDTTAKTDGRLSLNPVRHVDPVGLLCLLLFGIGWAKPVMVDPRAFKDPKQDMALTSFAGPLSNFLLAVIFTLIIYPFYNHFIMEIYTGQFHQYIYIFLLTCIYINISLGMFNMIPFPPLDGSKVFGAVLPDHLYFKFISGSRIGYIIFLILIWSGTLSDFLGNTVSTIADFLFNTVGKLYGLF